MSNQLKQGEALYVFLSVLKTALRSVLLKEEDKAQAPMYYTRRAFRGAEEKYLRAEKMTFALVITAW